jgi:predicted RNA-binding Zn-ribbon protein involved in translation (DUF1610 family)
MAIKFSCPNCGKALVVKDQLAGKRGACSGCKKVITIPFPVAEAHHENVEAMAMQAFADEPAAAAAPVETKTIAFECPMCDAKVQVTADLEGKRTPCPECGRIIKVPLQVKNEPKDWRTVKSRGPSGAKQNVEAAPEGAWSSSSAAGVSRETLVEAGAIVEEVDPDAKRVRLMRLTTAAIAVVFLGLAGLGTYKFLNQGKADKYLERALEMTKGESMKLAPEQAAVVHWAAAQYHARSRTLDAAQKTLEEYGQARAALAIYGGLGQGAMLVDLALEQVDLGGGLLEWTKAIEAVRQTLETIQEPEARLEAIRQVTRRLAAKGQARAAQMLAGKLGSSPIGQRPGEGAAGELKAAAALELIRSGNSKEGQALADSAGTAPANKEKPRGPGPAQKAVTPSVVALAVVLGREEPKPRKSGEKDEEKSNADDLDNILLGKAEGLARKAEIAAARELLGRVGPAVRLRGLVALADLALEASAGDVTDVTAALDLADAETKIPVESQWLAFRLVQLAVKAGMLDRATQLAGRIPVLTLEQARELPVKSAGPFPDAGVKSQAQLAVFRARLAGMKNTAEESLAAAVTENTGAAAQARQLLARHNVALDSSWAKNVENWSEADRAAGLAGAALGLQDRRK